MDFLTAWLFTFSDVEVKRDPLNPSGGRRVPAWAIRSSIHLGSSTPAGATLALG